MEGRKPSKVYMPVISTLNTARRIRCQPTRHRPCSSPAKRPHAASSESANDDSALLNHCASHSLKTSSSQPFLPRTREWSPGTGKRFPDDRDDEINCSIINSVYSQEVDEEAILESIFGGKLRTPPRAFEDEPLPSSKSNALPLAQSPACGDPSPSAYKVDAMTMPLGGLSAGEHEEAPASLPDSGEVRAKRPSLALLLDRVAGQDSEPVVAKLAGGHAKLKIAHGLEDARCRALDVFRKFDRDCSGEVGVVGGSNSKTLCVAGYK